MRRNWSGLRAGRRAGRYLGLMLAGGVMLGGECIPFMDEPPEFSRPPTLWVLVVDEQTGDGVEGASVTATVGGATVTLESSRSTVFQTARHNGLYEGGQGVGEYVVHVEAEGYEPVTTETIRVPERTGACDWDYATVYWRISLSPLGQ